MTISINIKNNPSVFTSLEHKFKRWYCTQKLALNVCLKISGKKNKSDLN